MWYIIDKKVIYIGENMKRKKSWTYSLPLTIIAGGLGVIPLIFMGFKDMMNQAGPLAGVYLGIAGFICGLGILEMIRRFILEYKENRLLKNSGSATRLKAIVLREDLGVQNTSTVELGVKNKVFIPIRYSYTDTNGNFVSKISAKLYTPLEERYLRDIGEFDILVSGRTTVIAENLDEQLIADFYSKR